MDDVPRILLADDAATVTRLVSRALEAAGYDVTVATDGYEAYEIGLSRAFDLALLDQLMPSMLGSEVLERWVQEEVPFPTIVLSGVEDDATVIRLLEIGAVDFIRKPFNVTELLIRVRRQLGTRQTPSH